MITDWRKKFGQSDLPFFYVQLAAYPEDYSLIRAAQGSALDLERVNVALAIDLGDPTSTHGAIHPRRKQPVGQRLALDILREVYGMGGGSIGPALVDVVLESEVGVVLELVNAREPMLRGTAACSECCYELPFEVLVAKTGNWTRVTQHPGYDEDLVFLRPNVGTIVGIRYAWEGYPQCALYNADSPFSLPMAPFKWCRYGGELPPWAKESCDLGPGLVSSS